MRVSSDGLSIPKWFQLWWCSKGTWWSTIGFWMQRIDCGIATETTWGHAVGDTMHRRCRCSNNFTNCIVSGVKPEFPMYFGGHLGLNHVTQCWSRSRCPFQTKGHVGDSPDAEVSFWARRSHGHWRVVMAGIRVRPNLMSTTTWFWDGYGSLRTKTRKFIRKFCRPTAHVHVWAGWPHPKLHPKKLRRVEESNQAPGLGHALGGSGLPNDT